MDIALFVWLSLCNTEYSTLCYKPAASARFGTVSFETLDQKILRGIGVLALIGVLTVGSLVAGTWFEHRAPLELPKPTGPFAVGRTTFHWVDDARPDEFAPLPGSPRELVAWVWYPAEPAGGTHAEYLPGPWREALARNGGVLMSEFLTRDLAQVRVHSSENVALAPDQRRYPVVILRAGLAAQVTGYTVLAEDLASHGYIVVGPDAAYRTTVVVFPDGRVVLRPDQYNLERIPEMMQESFATQLAQMWSTDVGFVVDKLTDLDARRSGRFGGRLDLQHLGIFGHSLGGATAAYFCHQDARCKAGIDLDGALHGPVINDGLHQPFMFVLEDHHKVPDSADVLSQIQSMYARLPADSRLRISLAGSNHFSFSDQILLKSQLLQGIMRRVGIMGGLEGARGLAITTDYVRSFFDVYLKGQPRTTLTALASRYPEVRVE
jgi:dienelactone hydrolase